ncbi:MAG TPA: hypothetical protein VHE80_04920, partial [Acidimicrobiales bacterium]|nr:hypothetical protein [Acidimicrobiales bacterium]
AWSDSRNGTFALPTEDVYFAKALYQDTAATGGRDPTVKASSLFLGLAIGLVVAGLAVLALSMRARQALGT